MTKPKRHNVTYLKKGDKVRVYKLTGEQLPGEYVVMETCKDEGLNVWSADLRKLRDNEYHPRARVFDLRALFPSMYNM